MRQFYIRILPDRSQSKVSPYDPSPGALLPQSEPVEIP